MLAIYIINVIIVIYYIKGIIMRVLITQWALDSYLDLVSQRVFSRQEYLGFIRPDVMLLKTYPIDVKFKNGKFWSAANDTNGKIIVDGFKMKWHQIGNGKVQLRLTVAMVDGNSYLCRAYVKLNDKVDKRELSKFKVYIDRIKQGRYTLRGELT